MSTEKIMEQAQVFASAWGVVGGPFDGGDAMEVATQEKDELRRMVGALAAELDALAAELAELEGQYPVFAFRCRGLPDFCTCTEGRYAELAEKPHLFEVRKLFARPVPAEMSPDFTDTARAALLWVLWHHQGGSSPVGQPIRYALGMDAHEHLSKHQVQEAKRWAALTKAESNDFRQARTAPPEPVNARLLAVATGKIPHLYEGRCPDYVNGPESRDPDCPACQAIAEAEAQQERLLQDMHDAGREIDRVMAEPQPDADGPWKSAVIDQLVIAHILTVEHESDPLKAIQDLLAYHADIAVDPRVSGAAAKLVEQAKADVESAATERANERANASWALMCEKMVAAEREACANVLDEGWFRCQADAVAAIRARGQK